MRLRIDLGIGHQHRAIPTYEVGDSFGKRDQSARGPDRLRQLVVAIAEEAERQRVLVGEPAVLLRRVVGDAEYLDPEFLELVPAVPQLVGLQRSTGGVGLGIEEEQERATLEVGTRNRGAVMGLELEIDKWLSDGNHLSNSFGVADHGPHRHQCERYQYEHREIDFHGTRRNSRQGSSYSTLYVVLTGRVGTVRVDKSLECSEEVVDGWQG
jgi:hypothetical protein